MKPFTMWAAFIITANHFAVHPRTVWLAILGHPLLLFGLLRIIIVDIVGRGVTVTVTVICGVGVGSDGGGGVGVGVGVGFGIGIVAAAAIVAVVVVII